QEPSGGHKVGRFESDCADNFLGELFSDTLGINGAPIMLREEIGTDGRDRDKSSCRYHNGAVRKRFLARYDGRVQNSYARDLFSLLHLRELILLRQQFKNGFFYFGLAEEIGIRDAQKRQLTDGRIKRQIVFCRQGDGGF